MARAAAALALCLLLALAAARDWQEEYQQRDKSEQQMQQVGQSTLSRGSAEQHNQQLRLLSERIHDQPQPENNRLKRQLPNNNSEIMSSSGVYPMPPTTSASPRLQAPPGYSQLGSFGFYKAFATTHTWIEAMMTCLADSAMLVVPNSEREAVAVGELYGKVKSEVQNSWDKNLFFVGANNLHNGSSYVTLIGTQFNDGQWHRWQKGEPTKGKTEHCIQCNEKGYYWDGNCQAKLGFVCRFTDNFQPTSRSVNKQSSAPQPANSGSFTPTRSIGVKYLVVVLFQMYRLCVAR